MADKSEEGTEQLVKRLEALGVDVKKLAKEQEAKKAKIREFDRRIQVALNEGKVVRVIDNS